MDYEKLKIVHELLDKNKEYYLVHTHNSKCNLEILKNCFELFSFDNKDDFYFCTFEIDDLLKVINEVCEFGE